MRDFIEKVKDSISIESIVGETVALKRSGPHLKGCCPLHHEKTPSFFVRTSAQTFHCYGCSKNGDVIQYIMERDGIPFNDALHFLAKKANIEVPMRKMTEEEVKKTHHTSNLKAATKAFQARLLENQSIAVTYWQSRGLSQETISDFGCGFAKGTEIDLLMSVETKQSIGIIHSDGKPVFAHRFTIPILDTTGNVIAWGARAVGTTNPKYLNSTTTDIYEKSKVLFNFAFARRYIRSKDEVIITEGYPDVMICWQCGIRNVVATCGTSLTENHIAELKRLCVDSTRLFRVVLAFNNDESGKKATIRAIPMLISAGFAVKVAVPAQKDILDIFAKDGNEGVQQMFSQIKDGVNVLFQSIVDEINPQTGAEIQEAAKNMCKIVSQLPENVRSHYIKIVAKWSNTDEISIQAMVSKALLTEHSKKNGLQDTNAPDIQKNLQRKETVQASNEDDIENLYKKNLKKFKSEATNNFPIDAFPPKTSAIIHAFQKADGFPLDYYGTNALVAISALMGVAYKAQYRQGHEHFPILYAVLVGDSSAGKSVSAHRFFQPLLDIEKNAANEYNIKMSIWHEASLSEKEVPPKPKRREIIIDNSTLEALIRTMYHNPRGILYLQEEVLSWIKNMNSYRSGSDEQFWLKNWDSAFVKYNRVSGDIITIAHPNATVIGGVQPGVIHQLLNGDKNVTGFSARLIFAYPTETKAPYDSDDYPSEDMIKSWQEIISYVDSLPNRIDAGKTYNNIPTVDFICIKCSNEAKKIYKKTINELTDHINTTENDALKSVYGKLKSYMIRFALILEVMRNAEEKINYSTWQEIQEHLYIGQSSMEGAYKLMKYYKHNSEKVLQRLETPVDSLKAEQQAWYRALPIGGILWKMAIISAEKIGFSKATANRLLNNTLLFKKNGDLYERRIS
jgi:DNA primase